MYPNVENMILVPINKKNWDYYEYPSLSRFIDELYYKANGGKKKLLLQIQSINIMYPNEKHLNVMPITKRVEFVMRRTWLWCPYQKEWSLLWVSKFFSIHRSTLTIRKMVEKKAFLANPKHQYHVSQQAGLDCNAHNKKNGVYYEYLSLSYFTDEH